MARRSAEVAAETDRLDGAPHPRDAAAIHGQEKAVAALCAALEGDRIPSGWLLAGPEGIGKATLAYRMAGALLTRRPGRVGPGPLDLPPDHPDLRLIRSGAHPRLFVLRRGQDAHGRPRNVITADEVRELRDFFGLSAADGGWRVVIVDVADDLNAHAANAILKILEEPPPRSVLVLVSHAPGRLLPTIRSRCRLLRLEPLAPTAFRAALGAIGLETDRPEALAELAGGSPGRAVRLIAGGGLDLYANIVSLFAARRPDRAAMVQLAETAGASRGSEGRATLLLDLLGTFMARLAQAPLRPPAVEIASGETAVLRQLAPHAAAARLWAEGHAAAMAAGRAGLAVNLDPAALILDTLLAIDRTARQAAAA